MTQLHALAGNWLIHSLGWTLLHFGWQGAVIAAVLWSALQLLGDRSSRTRYAACCGALLLLIVLPLATSGHISQEAYRAGRTLNTGVATVPGIIVRAGLGDAAWLGRLASLLDPAIPWILMAWLAGSVLLEQPAAYPRMIDVNFQIFQERGCGAAKKADPCGMTNK